MSGNWPGRPDRLDPVFENHVFRPQGRFTNLGVQCRCVAIGSYRNGIAPRRRVIEAL
jgi:hypothetical protein